MKTNQKPKSTSMRSIPLFTAALAALGMINGAHAQIQTAGDLLVNIDATTLSPGPLNAITNSGTMGGFFEARDANAVPEIAPVNGNGSRGIRFNGVSYMQHYDALGGALKLADPSLVGGSPTCSIEAWVFNPSISIEETILSWGKRGADGANTSFNYGSDFRWGAMGRWGNADIGWNDNGGAPAAGKWHHLVYTYDGTTTRMYSDGLLQNQEVFAVNTTGGLPINLATQLNADNTIEGGLRGSLTIARARIHSEALTSGQIANNYNFEKNDFNLGTPLALPSGPIHRYSFTNAPGVANNGDVVVDSVGTAHGAIRGGGANFTGSRVVLPGGPSASAPYIDLPNGLLSTNSVDNGGSGEVTFEGWVKVTGSRNWSRILDFGSSTVGGVQGEVTGVGGGGNGQDYLFYSAQNGGEVNVHTLVVKNADSPSGNVEDGLDVGTYTFNNDLHFAITWKESSGQVKIYENGVEVKTLNSRSRMSDINDVNVWLGRSNWAGDDNIQGEYDEFRIYNRVLPAEQVQASYQTGPNSLAVAVPVNFTIQPQPQSVNEFDTAVFTVAAEGAPPISYQWYRNGVLINGATSPQLVLTNVLYGLNGSTFFARASNNISGTSFTQDSGTASLTVNPDFTPPTILQVRVANSNAFEIIFSERVSATDAANVAHYSLFGPFGQVTLASAVQGTDASRVIVTAASSFASAYYQVRVSGIHDVSTSANQIADDSEGAFLYALPAGLQHRWTFNNNAANDATGTTVPDVVGGANGQVRNLTGITKFTGSRLTLGGGQSATAPYVDLPNGLLSVNGVANGGSGEMTIEGWFKITGNRQWSRIFDFGSTISPDTGGEVSGPGGGGEGRDYLFLSAQRDGDPGFRQISIRNEDPGGGGGNSVDYATTGLNSDTHFVVTWKESVGELRVYENGALKTVYGNGTKMSDIRDVNVWLGRSNWAGDQNTQGEYDEFRLYNRIITPDQVQADYAAGPDNIVGEPQSIAISVTTTNMVENDFQAARALVSFANVANMDLTASGAITYETSDPNVLNVDSQGLVTSLNAGVATVTTRFGDLSGSKTINVLAVPVVLKHRYSFCEQPGELKAHDLVGTAHGVLTGAGAAYSGGGTLNLNGVDSYVDLPNGIISSLSNATFEMWITYTDNRSWGRVFDFGSSTGGENNQGGGSNYIFFAAQGPANFRFESKPTDLPPSTLLFGSGPLPNAQEVHVAITYNELSGIVRLYTNGVLVDAGLVTVPLRSINDFNNWLGRSQYNDPYFGGSYNEFRIYEGAMTPAQVLNSFQQGPDAAVSSTSLSITRSGPNFIISYPAGNCDYFLESSTVLGPNAQWAPVNASQSQNGDRVEFTVPSDAPGKFFRLSK
jgi:hypothetical protein